MGLNVFIEAFYVSGPIASFVFFVLIAMSVLCWGLIIATAVHFSRLKKADQLFYQHYLESDKPADLFYAISDSEFGLDEMKASGLRILFIEIYKEVVTVEKHVVRLNFIDKKMQTIKANFNEMIQRSLQKVKNRENNKRERFFSFFATTSNVAPFIGLLGTVVGIINAFAAIGKAGSADLNFVAPAISEALVATALGLFVAIPASIAFNFFKAKSGRFRESFDEFSLDLLNRIQQQYFLRGLETATQSEEVLKPAASE